MTWLKIRDNEPSPYIFSFPHSGIELCEEMTKNLSRQGISSMPNTDWYLNELYDFLNNYSVNIISTDISRYVVDLNRSQHRNLFGTYRNSLIYSKNTWGEEIYQNPPTKLELNKRVSDYYKPYHEALDKMVTNSIERFGVAYVIDLHSFMGPISSDVCIGNVNGKSCSDSFISNIVSSFCKHGFQTVVNEVFSGGYLTQKYIDNQKVEAIAVELRYTNYLPIESCEAKRSPVIDSEVFSAAKLRLEKVFLQSKFIQGK
ncbi:N-formylglutamate amidohydrolase [Vibrio sp. RC27]